MAADVGTSLQPKHTNYRTEPVDEEGKRRATSFGEWDRQLYIKTGKHALGMRRPLDQFPEQIRFVRGKRVFDYNGYTVGGITVSERLKDAIEAIEPGIHQFVPVELLHRDGAPYGKPLWYFTICTLIDAISPQSPGLRKAFYTARPEENPDSYFWTILPGGRDKLAVSKEAIAGRAVWCDRRYITGTFFSDALLTRMRSQGMEGWDVATNWEEL